MKKITSALLIFTFVFIAIFESWQSAQASTSVWRTLNPAAPKISPALQQNIQALAADEMTTVIITLRYQTDLKQVRGNNKRERTKAVIRALHDTADLTQGRLKKLLDKAKDAGLVADYSPLWVINGISLTAKASIIDQLAKHGDVFSITPDDIQVTPSWGTPEPNVSLVNAPTIWNQGYLGQGIVVASMDTGVDVSHPELAARWRGGTNSWFDPYGQHPTTPTDMTGHGTWTTGIMVAGDAGGTSIGVAPSAQWIAVKIFNDQGNASSTAIHLGYQWLLDPDGDPNTADTPQVVNNSWTFAYPGCNLEFELDLQSLRAADILPVFAAGNGGPYSSTSYSPANNPSAFAVGAINNNNLIYAYSSRGPNACGGATGPYPKIVAPGVSILTTGLFGMYDNSSSGTSFAAPHVSGGLALLLSAYPNLDAAQQEQALINSAMDLGAVGPDITFGYGRLDLAGAFSWAAALTPTATPTPGMLQTDTPTSTNTPEPPTATDTSLPPTPTNTATPLPPTATNTLSPTPTATNTALPPTPTSTFTSPPPTNTPIPPTPTSTLPPAVHDVIYVSSASNGTVSGIAFQDEDILAYDTSSHTWAMYFDASDVGVTGDVDAFSLMPDGSILLSLDAPTTLSGVGAVDDSDIIRFTPTSLGANTAGTFSSYFVGANAGLTTNNEDIDALDFTPDGRLVVSTLGSYSVTGASGNDEDLIALNANGTSWSLYFDGSDVGLNEATSEQIDGVWIDPITNQVYLTTLGAFSVTGLSGNGADIFICTPTSLGTTTACNFSSYWVGALNGFAGQVMDGMDIVR
jgi:subtilisin family serine protease